MSFENLVAGASPAEAARSAILIATETVDDPSSTRSAREAASRLLELGEAKLIERIEAARGRVGSAGGKGGPATPAEPVELKAEKSLKDLVAEMTAFQAAHPHAVVYMNEPTVSKSGSLVRVAGQQRKHRTFSGPYSSFSSLLQPVGDFSSGTAISAAIAQTSANAALLELIQSVGDQLARYEPGELSANIRTAESDPAEQED